jgi:hypothetical protein
VGLTSAIHLDHRSVDLAISTVDIDSTTGEQFLLRNSGKEINVLLVGTPQSSMIVYLHLVQARPSILDRISVPKELSEVIASITWVKIIGPLGIREELGSMPLY